jgi:hypothetical protein
MLLSRRGLMGTEPSARWYTVLPVGFEPTGLDVLRRALVPLQAALTVGADHWSEAVDLASLGRYDGIVVAYPLRDAPLATFLGALRRPQCPCHSSSVVLVAGAGFRAEAEMYIGRGANRVVGWEEVELRLAAVLDALFHAAPRVFLNAPSRIQIVSGGSPGRVACRTVNISSTGMLLDVPQSLRPGTLLSFELMLPGLQQPVCGRARVVRGTTQPGEPFSGVGVVFAAFEGSNEGRLTSYLERFSA